MIKVVVGFLGGTAATIWLLYLLGGQQEVREKPREPVRSTGSANGTGIAVQICGDPQCPRCFDRILRAIQEVP